MGKCIRFLLLLWNLCVCCRHQYKVVDSYSLRYRLTLSAAAVNSELFQSVLVRLENLPSQGWNFISVCHDTLHCTCFLMIQSVSATWSLRFLTSQTQLLKLNIKRKWKTKKRKKKVISFYRNRNTKMNWRIQKQMHNYQ